MFKKENTETSQTPEKEFTGSVPRTFERVSSTVLPDREIIGNTVFMSPGSKSVSTRTKTGRKSAATGTSKSKPGTKVKSKTKPHAKSKRAAPKKTVKSQHAAGKKTRALKTKSAKQKSPKLITVRKSRAKTAIKPKLKKVTKPDTTVRKTKTRSAAKTKITKTAPKKITKTSKKRKPRIYSNRSRLSSFHIGDEVVFRKFRDWNNDSRIVEMKGVIVTKGKDRVSELNFIEVEFELVSLTGSINRQVRRFFVK